MLQKFLSRVAIGIMEAQETVDLMIPTNLGKPKKEIPSVCLDISDSTAFQACVDSHGKPYHHFSHFAS